MFLGWPLGGPAKLGPVTLNGVKLGLLKWLLDELQMSWGRSELSREHWLAVVEVFVPVLVRRCGCDVIVISHGIFRSKRAGVDVSKGNLVPLRMLHPLLCCRHLLDGYVDPLVGLLGWGGLVRVGHFDLQGLRALDRVVVQVSMIDVQHRWQYLSLDLPFLLEVLMMGVVVAVPVSIVGQRKYSGRRGSVGSVCQSRRLNWRWW